MISLHSSSLEEAKLYLTRISIVLGTDSGPSVLSFLKEVCLKNVSCAFVGLKNNTNPRTLDPFLVEFL
jgi:hypothetical protein